MQLKKSLVQLVVLIVLILLSSCNANSTTPSYSPAPSLSFSKVGVPIVTSDIAAVYAQLNHILISMNSITVESHGIVPYLRIDDDASSSTQYSEYSLSYNSESYILYGSIIVDDLGTRYLPVAESEYTGYSLLSYSVNDIFESAVSITNESWIRPITFGAFDALNLYINVDDGSGSSGSLGAIPLAGGNGNLYPNLFPTWYAGEFVINNQSLYYSGNEALYSSPINSGKGSQIGEQFNQLFSGIVVTPGMLDSYGGNIYIGASYTIGQNTYLAVCMIAVTSSSSSGWLCKYDPSTTLGFSQNITSFRLGQTSGNVIVAVSDYLAGTTQLYVLNSSMLTN